MTLGRMFRLLATVCLVPLLNGCFGGVLVQEHTMRNSNVVLQSEPGYIATASGHSYGKQDVLEKWGPPYAKDMEGQIEVWKYHRELAFSGLFLVVIVPIPLLPPVGHRDTILHFADDKLVEVIREYGGGTGFGCLFLPTGGAPCRRAHPHPPEEWRPD